MHKVLGSLPQHYRKEAGNVFEGPSRHTNCLLFRSLLPLHHGTEHACACSSWPSTCLRGLRKDFTFIGRTLRECVVHIGTGPHRLRLRGGFLRGPNLSVDNVCGKRAPHPTPDLAQRLLPQRPRASCSHKPSLSLFICMQQPCLLVHLYGISLTPVQLYVINTVIAGVCVSVCLSSFPCCFSQVCPWLQVPLFITCSYISQDKETKPPSASMLLPLNAWIRHSGM